jgi:mono/diheme cytochrome c family protein
MQAQSFMIAALCATLLTGCTEGIYGAKSSVARGKSIYAKECSQCHGTDANGAGAASLGLGVPPPDLVGLTSRNDGYFPREFVRRFVLGSLQKDDPDAAMPEFGSVGMQHVHPNGGPEALSADIDDLLDYLETIQE